MAKKKSELSFEQSLEKLEQIVNDIEQGKIGLEESIQQFEEGVKLVKHCRKVLSAAEQKIQKLHLSTEGDLIGTPMDGTDSEQEDAE